MTASPSASEALAVKAAVLFSAAEMFPAFEKVGAWFATVESVDPDEPDPAESVELVDPDPDESVESVEPDEPDPEESDESVDPDGSSTGSGRAATASLSPPLALAWVVTSAWVVNSSVVISFVTNCVANVVLFSTISLIAVAVVVDVSTVTPLVAT